MKRIFMILSFVLLAAGCGFFEQARKDYQLHKETPYAEGEITVQQKTQGVTGLMAGIPYVNLGTPAVLLIGPYIFGWLRGRKIRAKMSLHPLPITGSLGQKLGFESIVQHLADVAAGLFEVGQNGSTVKRGWKVALASALGLALAPEAQDIISTILIPALQNHPPAWLSGLFNGSVLALVIGGLGAAEKWLSKVQPVAPKLPIAA